MKEIVGIIMFGQLGRVYLFVVCGFVLPALMLDAADIVRVPLKRTTALQAGELGEPVTSYLVSVNVGTPQKTFDLVVDISASETWLPHHLRLGAVFTRLNYKNGYAKRDSTTGVKEDKEYSIEYRGCKLSGKAYEDVFEFKDAASSSNKSQRFNQRFLAISSASNDNIGRLEGVDGVFPLNPWPLSWTNHDLPMTTMRKDSVISEKVFSLSLNSDTIPESAHGGELILGQVPNGHRTFHTCINRERWELNLQSVMLGNNIVSCSDRKCKATLSTSRNDFLAPKQDLVKILQLLGFENVTETAFDSKKLYEVDCLKVADAPPLTVLLDGSHYVVRPTSYIRKKVDGWFYKSATCYVAILASKSEDEWELGTNFLANFQTVFDVQRQQVAFKIK